MTFNPRNRTPRKGHGAALMPFAVHHLCSRPLISRARATAAAAFVVTALTAFSAWPQSAPTAKSTPTAASKPRLHMAASEPRAVPTVTAVAGSNAAPPNPVIPDPRRNVPANIFSSFDATQKAQAAKASAYLSSLTTLIGNFVQIAPDGSRSKGDFFLQKPGKIRFEYDEPSPIAMIADGSSLAVRDRKLATQDIYPLSQTPLRYLLADRIDLLRDTNVVSISSDALYVSIIIEEKSVIVGTSRLLLMFGAKDNQLKQWTVTDPQGYDTTVAVYNLDTAKKPDPSLFKIDFTKYPGSPG